MGSARSAALAALSVVALVTAWAYRPLWDVDLFWHIATGRLIADQGLPETDVFSAADPSQPWTTFQWGYQVLVARLHESGGLGGLRALHALVIGLALGAWTWLQARRSGLGVALCSAVVLLLLFEDRVRARPHVFELLFVVLLMGLVRGGRTGAALMALGLAPLWANLHAVSAVWWLALVGAWTVGERSQRSAAVLVLGALALASAPNAIEGVLTAGRTHATWPDTFVPELARPWVYVDEGWWGYLMLAGVAAGLVSAADLARRDAPLAEKIVAVGTAVAALLLARWVWFAALPIGFWLARARPRGQGLITLGALLALALHVGPRWSLAERAEDLQPGAFPEGAAAWMLDKGLAVATDTTTQWSGYWLYAVPGSRVLADGRLLFSDDVAELLLRRADGDATTFDAAVGRFHTLALVWPAGDLPPLDPSRWRRIYADEVAEVWLPSPAWGRIP